MSLALKKALTSANIRAGFKGTEIWPLNLEAMKSKMGPSEGFVPHSAAEARFEEELNEEIMGEDIVPPSQHATYYYVDSMQEDVFGDDKDEEENPSIHDNISNFLRMPQEVVTIKKARAEPFIDYSQSQILTSAQHVDALHNIAAKKEKIAEEREAKKVEREFTKEARAAKKRKQREAKEHRIHEKQARMTRNTPQIMAAQEEAKRLFKSKWTTSACEEQGQRLHDLIKKGYASSCQSPYLGRQPLVCKRNQAIAFTKLKAKREKKKHGIPLPNFELPWLLPHFHGVRDSLLELDYPMEFVRPAQLPPSLFCTGPPSGPHPGHPV